MEFLLGLALVTTALAIQAHEPAKANDDLP